MNVSYQEIIQQHSCALKPLPTDETPQLKRLDGIRGVLFDVYGTLLISGSGDVGTSVERAQVDALTEALDAVGIPIADPAEGVRCFVKSIGENQRQARQKGAEHPEVDIVDVWQRALQHMADGGWIQADFDAIDVQRLAIEYEVRINPTWPMPGVRDCIRRLRQRGLALGLVSNAQFFTLELFPALLGGSTNDLGFDVDFEFYSFRYRRAKPGRFLYELAREAFAKRGMAAEEILYVGNDMLNDVMPASQVGFQTALFAGDARSLRRRVDDQRLDDVEPDLVITELLSICECIGD